jgi:hypothetical protein
MGDPEVWSSSNPDLSLLKYWLAQNIVNRSDTLNIVIFSGKTL